MLKYEYILNKDLKDCNKLLRGVESWALMLNENDEYAEDFIFLFLDDKIIGYLMCSIDRIFKVEIKEEFQRNGYGKGLLEFFIYHRKTFQKDGKPELIHLICVNKKIKKLYERIGFKSHTRNVDNMSYRL